MVEFEIDDPQPFLRVAWDVDEGVQLCRVSLIRATPGSLDKQAGPGGGSQPGAAIWRGPFSFAFDDAAINDGIAFYTPTVGDLLLDVYPVLDTSFDGTTPFGDVGTFVGTNNGLFSNFGGFLDLSAIADDDGANQGYGGAGLYFNSGPMGTLAEFAANNAQRFAPLLITAANPLKIVVSRTGAKGGTAVGGAAGAGRLYICTATPVALP